MPAKRTRETAIAKLQMALSTMGTPGMTPSTALSLVKGMVQDALDLIQESDPLKKRVAFIVLALQESTEIHVVALRGKEHERILIRDRPLYEWAMKQVHRLAEPQQEAA
ncbi:hypothetical protein [Xanthomonas campestris]|uniref:hypothetical protein n=1 Tax=Xanthomonas campestris TaxID=339 RepID=UPI0005AF3A43|nr:hypothetical protein [Xanthomonas campestris]KIQ21544.1 hypothetical protein RT95_20540 [Xanthomonas campestris]